MENSIYEIQFGRPDRGIRIMKYTSSLIKKSGRFRRWFIIVSSLTRMLFRKARTMGGEVRVGEGEGVRGFVLTKRSRFCVVNI